MKYKWPKLVARIFTENPELRMVPEFNALSARKMCFVILVCDTESPLRYLKYTKDGSNEKMREQAAKSLGYMTSKLGSLSVDGKKLVFDEIPEVRMAEKVYTEMMGGDILETFLELKEGIMAFMKNIPSAEDEKAKWSTQVRAYVKENTLMSLQQQIDTLMKEANDNSKTKLDKQEEEPDAERTTNQNSSKVMFFDIDNMGG